MRMLFIALLATLGLAQPVLAENQILYAECGDAGCACLLSPVTLGDYEALTGSPPPAGAENMVLVNSNGAFLWSTLSPDEIDLASGGDGTCEIGLFSIVPQDGTWRGSVRVQNIDGCLPQVAQMVPPLVDGTNATKPIAWGGKFHPSQFVVGSGADRIQWTERSPVRFDGVFPIPPNDILNVTATATSTLTAPDKAEATLALRFAAAPGADAGALALIGMAKCRVDAVYDFERVGP
ncbi:MAG: hypothetical protein MUC82_13530 [Cypionkella sp.]|jgi:hypothetical protein|nr:hypothetical protein [Cypionkella sp.]